VKDPWDCGIVSNRVRLGIFQSIDYFVHDIPNVDFALPHKRRDIKFFHLFPRPGRSAQEFQGGLHGRIAFEAIDVDFNSELLPPVVIDKPDDEAFESEAVQRIFRLFRAHDGALST